MDFSRVEAERNNLNLTKEEFAEKVGATQRTYYNWINGKNPIPSDVLIKMAEVCGCTTDYLLGIDRKDEVENKYEGRKEVLGKLKLQFEKVHAMIMKCEEIDKEDMVEMAKVGLELAKQIVREERDINGTGAYAFPPYTPRSN